VTDAEAFGWLESGCRDVDATTAAPWNAITRSMTLIPVNGEGQKVFPPTYPGARNRSTYVREQRRRDGTDESWVLLDSVQSHANRLEMVLERYGKDLCLPHVSVTVPGHGAISAIRAPHRIYDAIFRASLDRSGKPFLETDLGRAVAASSADNAQALLEYCPTALLFGGWDSHGALGGGGTKVPRAVVAEMSALEVGKGAKVGSRIDSLGIRWNAGVVYRSAEDSIGWTLDPGAAEKDEKNKPVPVGKGTKAGRPSVVGLGNVTPTIDGNTGGVYVSHAVQSFTLSLVQIRQLQFPAPDPAATAQRNAAGRLLLCCLALYALLRLDADGYLLRSRCHLVPTAAVPFTLIGPTAESRSTFEIDLKTAMDWVKVARQQAEAVGFRWGLREDLLPSPQLLTLVRNSDAIARATAVAGVDADPDEGRDADAGEEA